MELLSEHACFGGVQGYYRHDSAETGLPMRFSVFQPPQATQGPVPVLFFLAGLTCTEETFMIKAGAQRLAAQLGIMLVTPDTSPRDAGIEGESASWDFGVGAGFYVDATQAPWSKHYRMYSYVVQELRQTIIGNFPARADRIGIFRPFDGWSWRADAGTAQSRHLSFGLGICADCGTDAMSVGAEGIRQLSRGRSVGLGRA